MTTPLSTETPNRAIKPTLALTLKLKWPTTSARIPPMSAKGMLRMMSAACLTELNELNSNRKMDAMVIGTTTAKRFIARSRSLVGGWEFAGTARIQSGTPINLGNVRLVGMSRTDLQKALKLRFDDANKVIYSLPQDIIDNTIKAFNTSATSTTGYGDNGAPNGRYIAPANSATCIEVIGGDCGGTRVLIYAPRFTRIDLSAVKRTRITERMNFEFRAEFLNAFNYANFNVGLAGFANADFGRVTSAYRDNSNTNDLGGRIVQLVARINF